MRCSNVKSAIVQLSQFPVGSLLVAARERVSGVGAALDVALAIALDLGTAEEVAMLSIEGRCNGCKRKEDFCWPRNGTHSC